jgi:hypothetical protein
MMVRAVNIIVALVCLVCVIIVCIAPFVDLPETIIQPLQSVLLLMLALVAGMFLYGSRRCITVLRSMFPVGRMSSRVRFLHPIEIICVQQC